MSKAIAPQAASITLAVDAMGGDDGLEATLPGVKFFIKKFPDSRVILVGDESQIQAGLEKFKLGRKVDIRHASEVVGMGEDPRSAIRKKKDSSMRVAIDMVKAGDADAVVSSGNTGALMAMAKFVLKTLPGIDRPAIISPLPNPNGHSLMLDLGANLVCSAELLMQFSVMGVALAKAQGNDNPRVALLNVGSEEVKGVDEVRRASDMLSQSGMNYIGFVEGNDIYTGAADVIVCDGFVGNVALKTTEGVVKMLGNSIKEAFTASVFAKMAGLASFPVLKAVKSRLSPSKFNGAMMIGLNGVVFKSHGSADKVSFANALELARQAVVNQVPAKISMELSA